MAKARVIVKCATCGAEIVKETTKSNRTECDKWESWIADQEHQCNKCWHAEQMEKDKAKGLVLDVDVIAEPTQLLYRGLGNKIVRLSFSGDSMPHKDKIKALGYSWADLLDTGFLGFLGGKRSKKAWQKHVAYDEVEAECKKAYEIGAAEGEFPTDQDLMMALTVYKQTEKIKAEKKAEMDEKIAAIDKPVPPDVWEQKVEGHRTNRTIYGGQGRRAIYLDGEKVSLTDAEAEELEAYWTAREAYDTAVKRIEEEGGLYK